jgi:hypothetical protein
MFATLFSLNKFTDMENKIIKSLNTIETVNGLFILLTKDLDLKEYPFLVVCEFEDKNETFMSFFKCFKKADNFCLDILEKNIYSICFDATQIPVKFKIYSKEKLGISKDTRIRTQINNYVMSN